MKFFACIVFAAAVMGFVSATSNVGSTSVTNTNINQEVETEAQPVQNVQLNSEFNRYRKSAGYGSSGGYGAASIPAPPCPKNYLFSCQPNLSPVPCSAPSASYGSSGAYSAPLPSYVAPLGNNYGIPQTYGGFVPQQFNQYY